MATQRERLLDYLRQHPEGVTSLDVTYNLRIVNVTGRVSDLRAAGHNVVCDREGERFVFRLAPECEQTTLRWTA